MLIAILKKLLINFWINYGECKPCNIQRNLKRYYEKKDKLSNQRNLYYERNRDVLLAKSKLNQQNRNFERKIYKQQMENSIKS